MLLQSLGVPRPRGLGIGIRRSSLQSFLLATEDLRENEKIVLDIGAYAVSKTLASMKALDSNVHRISLLRLHAHEGIRGSKARTILSR